MNRPSIRVMILGEYSPESENHRRTETALADAAGTLGITLERNWVSTTDVSEETLVTSDALFVATGSPYRDFQKALEAIRIARERSIPCLGTCGGFQHMVVEYARNVLGISNAGHGEYDLPVARVIISKLACSLAGRIMRLTFAPNSKTAALYGTPTAEEEYYCSFGIDPAYVSLFRGGQFRSVGADAEGEIRVMEMANHPFYVGTLFVPQARSAQGRPHPLITEFVKAAIERRTEKLRSSEQGAVASRERGLSNWAVWRQDDSGSKFLIEANLAEGQAQRMVAEYEARGHKQTYWCNNETNV